MIDSQQIRTSERRGHSTPEASEYTVEVATTIDEVTALRREWQAMQPQLNADMDYYLTVVGSRDEIIRPHVVVLKRNGVPQAFLIGRLETTPVEVWLGYGTVRLPAARRLTFICDGLLGDPSENSVSHLVGSAVNSIRHKEADLARFENLSIDSPLFEAVRGAKGALYRDPSPEFTDHWKGQLYSSYGEYLSRRSPKMRRNIRRLTKRLQDAAGRQITIKRYRCPDEVETLLADCEAIVSKTYQRGLHVGFSQNVETRRLMALAAAKKWLYGYVMYVGGEPTAFWNGFLYQRRLSLWTTAYTPWYREFYTGLFLLQHMIEDLAREQAADAIDFGPGNYQYKRESCDQNFPEVSVLLFAPTLRGILIQTLRTALIAGAHVTRWLIRRVGLLQGMKKLWKRRQAKQAKLAEEGQEL
jgi:CelD/BcsL family acetyltransferase involved in cellulose biosynthesis